MSCLIGGGGRVGYVIISLHLGVDHSVLCQMEGVGHVFLTTTFRNAPPPLPPSPLLFDQSLSAQYFSYHERTYYGSCEYLK